MLTESQIRKDLKKKADTTTVEALSKWNSTTWASLIAIGAGLSPFSETALKIVPAVLQVFLSKSEFVPTKEDQSNACRATKNALTLVNNAILEATKGMYMNIIKFSGTDKIPSLDAVLEGLSGDLFDYDKRKSYFQAGLNMMSDQEVWLGRHHVMATGLLFSLRDSERKLSEEEFLTLATDTGILVDGEVQYNPFKIRS